MAPTSQFFICPGILMKIAQEAAFASYGELRKIKKGSLFAFGPEEEKDFFYVASGFLAINYYECTGQWRCQLFLGPGSLGNEAHLLTNFTLNQSQYYCNTDCELLWLPVHKLDEEKLLADSRIIQNLAVSQTIKSMVAQAVLNALTMRSNLQQICWFLDNLYQFHHHYPRMQPAISQQQMASFLGIPERTFKRHINWLKEEGIINTITRKNVAVADPGALSQLATPDRF